MPKSPAPDELTARWPLRYIVPMVLVAFVAMASWWSVEFSRGHVSRSAEQEAVLNLRWTTTQLAGALERASRVQDLAAMRHDVALFGANPAVVSAVLTDENYRVIASLSFADVDRTLEQAMPSLHLSAPDLQRAQLETMRASLIGTVKSMNDNGVVVAARPVVLGIRPDETRPTRVGMLVVVYDVAPTIGRALTALQRQALIIFLVSCVLAIALGLFLHFRVTKRIERLSSIARQVHAGDLDVQSGVAGSDEVAVLAATFDRMILARSQAQGKPIASESDFRALLEQAAVGVAQIDSKTGQFVEINQCYCDIVGYSRKKMLDLDFAAITHPDDLQPYLDQMSQLIAGDVPEFTLEKRYHRNDGSIVWVQLTVSPMWQSGEEPSTHIAIVEDITDRKRSEADVRLRDHAFASSSNGIVISDASEDDFPIIYCNPAFEKMTGYTKDEVRGQNCRFLQGKDRDQSGLEAIRNALRLGHNVTSTLRNYRKDGTMFWSELRLSPVHDDAGQLTHFIGFQTDVTGRKQFEQQLRLTQSSVDTCSTSIFWIRPDARFVYVNEAASHRFGYTADEWLSLSVSDVDPAYPAEAWPNFWESIQQHRTLMFETSIKHKDGALVPVEITTNLLKFEGDEYVFAFVTDITARKQAEEELRFFQDEMAHMLRINTMTEMAAGIAHELNQPLCAIANYARVCINRLDQTENSDYEDVHQHLETISELAHQSGSVIRNLCEFTQRRSGQMKPTGIGALIRTTLEMLQFELRKSKISIELNLPEPDMIVTVDPVQIRQVIVNLIKNAIDAMLSTSSDDRILTIAAHRQGGTVELQFSDRGTGILTNQMQQLFDPFISSKPNGTGIGLSISSRILTAHRGSLDAWNNEGDGATFRFTLPLEERQSA